jgi:hypothetical protein
LAAACLSSVALFRDPTLVPEALSILIGERGSVEDRESEGERSQKIIRRANGVRERAAESLRRVRALRKKQGQADAAQKRRRFRRQD